MTERPQQGRPLRTPDLPDTPVRDRVIAATDWVEAPPRLLALGDDFGGPVAGYRRRIHGWLLWRSGPPNHGDARYLAIDSTDVSRSVEFRLRPDGSGTGVGPSGATHTRFRTWKEDLRDHPCPG